MQSGAQPPQRPTHWHQATLQRRWPWSGDRLHPRRLCFHRGHRPASAADLHRGQSLDWRPIPPLASERPSERLPSASSSRVLLVGAGAHCCSVAPAMAPHWSIRKRMQQVWAMLNCLSCGGDQTKDCRAVYFWDARSDLEVAMAVHHRQKPQENNHPMGISFLPGHTR